MLIAGIEAQILGTMGMATVGESTSRALLTLTWLAFFMALGATMSSLILTQELAVVAVRAAKRSDDPLSNVSTFDGSLPALIS